MLTISQPLNAGQAQSYHAKEFAAAEKNYWQKGDEGLGQWQGTLASELGLAGTVSAEDFTKVAAGIHPATGKVLVRSKASTDYTTAQGETIKPVEHRAGWDATFSAPKSVSLTALVGGDDRVRVAHREAVTEALAQLETYTHARMGGNREALRTGSFLAAKFEHDTARPVDGYAAPQLHTHVVIFNITRDAIGATRSLESKALMETQQFATAVYQAELTVRLRALGYELERGKSGAPEIRGYTREYIEASSPRSQQIREYLEASGFQGPAAAQIAAHSTRDNKMPLGKEEVLAAHRQIAEQHGNQAERVLAEARQRGRGMVYSPDIRVREAITYAKHRSFEREAVTDERLLMRDALRHGMGHIVYAQVKPAFDARVATGEFLATRGQRYSSGRLYTTPATIAQERQAVQSSLEGQNQQRPIVSREQAAAYVERLPRLNEGQRTAIETVLSSPDRVQGLQGLAGTGKTTALRAIREAAEQAGYAVEGMAPTSKATQQLREAGISAGTLQGYLARGSQPKAQADPASRHLYMLDESSLASTRQMRDFLQRIGLHDRVIVIGDIRQHQGVDAGKPFEQMQDAGMKTALLDRIVRQQDPALLAAVEKLSKNETREGIAMLSAQGRITEIADKSARIEAIARAYADRTAGSIIVSPDNASRRAINEEVRHELQKRGALSKDETPLPTLIPRNEMTGADRAWASAYYIGDVLRYARGSKEPGIERSSYATVTGIDKDNNRLTVETQSGASISYDPRRLQGISAYLKITRNFSRGDRIQFTAPNKELEVANREMATIVRIEGPRVIVKLDGDQKRQVTFDSRDMRHFDHGYAVTSHSSQGVTAERVLVNMDTRTNPELINTRFAYVAVSRASQDAQIFTNDAEALGQRLSRDVTKSSAIDFRQAHKADEALERAATPASTREVHTSIDFGI
jgi:conjugative relaxase-like TrwC/TraI family protein